MKKTIKMIGMACLVGALAFAGSSCKKNNTDTTSIRVIMPSVEETTIDGERAYIDFSNNRIKWSKGDQIMFYNLAENPEHSVRNVYTLYSGANNYDANFSGDVMGELNEGFDGYYGFYPASKVENHELGPRNSQTFDVPAIQNYNAGNVDPTSLVLAVKGADIMTHFTMDHIFGFADLKLKGTKAVDRIVISDNEFPLSGNVTLDIPYIDYSTAIILKNRCRELADYRTNYATVWAHIDEMTDAMNYSAEGGGRDMTLECGGVQLNSDTYTNFILTLRPGALHHGFSVTVYYADETSETFNKFNPDSDAWGFANNQACPRAFCVIPGVITHFSLN